MPKGFDGLAVLIVMLGGAIGFFYWRVSRRKNKVTLRSLTDTLLAGLREGVRSLYGLEFIDSDHTETARRFTEAMAEVDPPLWSNANSVRGFFAGPLKRARDAAYELHDRAEFVSDEDDPLCIAGRIYQHFMTFMKAYARFIKPDDPSSEYELEWPFETESDGITYEP